jgi:DNA-binding NarL/FixJ family response regulator
MESYIIRIYRRYDNQVEGLIERPLTGDRKLFHSAEELWAALTESVAGRPLLRAEMVPEQGVLTARQLVVLSYICRGKDNKEIAAACGVSYRTIKTHVSAILKALGVANRTQAVLAARRLGLPTD